MRSIAAIIVLSIVITSCSKNGSPSTPLDNTVDTTMTIGRYRGMFINGPYGSVSGTAAIYFQNDQYLLALEGVSISNGPDLHVYVSKEILPVNFIDLGRLQSTMGNHVYAITGNPDFTQYKYALIHCQRYNHLFGSAELR